MESPEMLTTLRDILACLEQQATAQARVADARAARIAEDPWLRVEDVAAITTFHPDSIRAAAREKELAYYRRGRKGEFKFRLSDVERWMNRGRVKARRQ